MQDFIGILVQALMVGGLIIARVYFIYYLSEFLVALMRSLGVWLRINTEKKKQEVENPVKILKIRYAKGEIKKIKGFGSNTRMFRQKKPNERVFPPL